MNDSGLAGQEGEAVMATLDEDIKTLEHSLAAAALAMESIRDHEGVVGQWPLEVRARLAWFQDQVSVLTPVSLIDLYFDGGPNHWNGRVIAEPSPGIYLAERYMDERGRQHLIHIRDMMGFTFYETDKYLPPY